MAQQLTTIQNSVYKTVQAKHSNKLRTCEDKLEDPIFGTFIPFTIEGLKDIVGNQTFIH